jgi:hypothetical protein
MEDYVKKSELVERLNKRIKQLKVLLYETKGRDASHIMGRLFELSLLLDLLGHKTE